MQSSSFEAPKVPNYYLLRKLHSLSGIWIVIFLMEHLFTNSQAALYLGENGAGFIKAVDWIKNLPYLQVIELTFIAMPIFIHAILGVRYLFTSKDNVVSSDGSRPSLGRYAENRFYRWQRITSWILLLAIFGHVVQMRFINYPDHVKYLDKTYYLTTVSGDSGLLPLSKKLHFKLFDAAEIEAFLKVSAAKYQSYISGFKNLRVASSEQKELTNWYQTIEKFQLNSNERLILTSSFGTAVLMMVRDTFKSPLMIFLYSIFVIAACFHAFNGMWTAFISWGISLSKRSQNIFRALFMFLMTLLTFLGLAAIWLTYYVNLF